MCHSSAENKKKRTNLRGRQSIEGFALVLATPPTSADPPVVLSTCPLHTSVGCICSLNVALRNCSRHRYTLVPGNVFVVEHPRLLIFCLNCRELSVLDGDASYCIHVVSYSLYIHFAFGAHLLLALKSKSIYICHWRWLIKQVERLDRCLSVTVAVTPELHLSNMHLIVTLVCRSQVHVVVCSVGVLGSCKTGFTMN